MDHLIGIIRLLGWFAASCGRPVLYSTKFFNTSQDYMVMEPYSLWVYDKLKKRKRKVTLSVSSQDKRDRKKTEISTFVNFIHQKDAFIAMSVIEDMRKDGYPIYTVHDNLICTITKSQDLPGIYRKVFHDLGAPLKLVNNMIWMNLISIPIEKGIAGEENSLTEKKRMSVRV